MELADWAAVGHRDGLLKLHRVLRGRWVETHPGFLAGVLGIAAAPFNRITIYAPFDEAKLMEDHTRVADSGLPFSLQARPAVSDAAAAVAERFAMAPGSGMPMMGLTDPPNGPAVDGLALRRLGPEAAELHATLTAKVFGTPIEVARTLTPPEAMSGHGGHFLGGEIAGETVATAMADVNDRTAWLYAVATADAYRRRGLGAAVTAAAVRAAFADGADMAFLLSSPMAVRVYESIGFRELEWWSSWERLPEV
jgi:GNAT superfamily N-acetyltransferase